MLCRDVTRGTSVVGAHNKSCHREVDQLGTIMVKRCVAAGCSNTYSNGVSFPKDPQLRKKWTDKVKRARDKWEGSSDDSVLCSCHFGEECFEPEAMLAIGLGLGGKRKP